MAKLARHWHGINSELDWILIEQELTSSFKPIEALAQTLNKEKDNMKNPILAHSKSVWQDLP